MRTTCRTLGLVYVCVALVLTAACSDDEGDSRNAYPTPFAIDVAERELGWRPLRPTGDKWQMSDFSTMEERRDWLGVELVYYPPLYTDEDVENAELNKVILSQGQGSYGPRPSVGPQGASSDGSEDIAGFEVWFWKVDEYGGIATFDTGIEVDGGPINAFVMAGSKDKAREFIEALE